MEQLNLRLQHMINALEQRLEAAGEVHQLMRSAGAARAAELHQLRDRSISVLLRVGEAVDQTKRLTGSLARRLEGELISQHGLKVSRDALASLAASSEFLIKGFGIRADAGERLQIFLDDLADVVGLIVDGEDDRDQPGEGAGNATAEPPRGGGIALPLATCIQPGRVVAVGR